MTQSRPPFSSVSGEPKLRRLGVGGSNGERPLRAQLVVAVAMAVILLGVPLYFLRRPSPSASALASASAGAPVSAPGIVRSKVDAGASRKKSVGVQLGEVQRVKCSASPQQRGNEGAMCDGLPVLEEALKKAIKSQVQCVPKTTEGGTINFVLNVDFRAQRTNLFAGASGTWRGPQAKRTTQCVERALATIKWNSISHQYRFYTLAVMATYPEPSAVDVVPMFE